MSKVIAKFLENILGRKKYFKFESDFIEGIKVWALSNPHKITSDDEDVCDIMNAFDRALLPIYAAVRASTRSPHNGGLWMTCFRRSSRRPIANVQRWRFGK
jgi:hypothetical protein